MKAALVVAVVVVACAVGAYMMVAEPPTTKWAEMHPAEQAGRRVACTVMGRGCIAGELFTAITQQDDGQLRALLDTGAVNVDVVLQNMTPLYLAVRKGTMPAVRMLLDAGAALVGDEVVYAAAHNQHDMVTALLDAGASPTAGRGEERLTPLIAAAQSGSLDTVQTLVRLGVPLDTKLLTSMASTNAETLQKSTGGTAMHAAASAGHVAILRELAAAGATIDPHDKVKSTPLILAAKAGHQEAVEALLDLGANVNHGNFAKMTPFLMAVWHRREALALFLKERGAAADATAQDGQSALHYAARQNLPEVMKALLADGADPNIRDLHGSTPLFFAATKNNVALISALVAAGADVDIASNTGITPLIAAVVYESDAALEALINLGADLDLRTTADKPALMFAIEAGRIRTSRKLVAAGADVRCKNEKGESVRYLAHKRKYKRLLKDVEAALDRHERAGGTKGSSTPWLGA